jgi:hypothetical protein
MIECNIMQPMHWSTAGWTMHTASDTHASLYIQSADSNHTIAPGPARHVSCRDDDAVPLQSRTNIEL